MDYMQPQSAMVNAPKIAPPINSANAIPNATPLNAPPLNISPNTVNLPPIDYTKTAAQTGFPTSILPRGGNGAADMASAERFMQRTNPSAPQPQTVGAIPIRGAGAAAIVGVIGQTVLQPGFFQNPVQGLKNILPEWAGGPKATDPWEEGKKALEKAGLGGAPQPKAPGNSTNPKMGPPEPGMPNAGKPGEGNPGNTPNHNGSGGGGMAGDPSGTKPLDPFAPLRPLLPWLPDWKMPKMPWDPQTPAKPDKDPKKPAKPGNPGAPNGGKPGKPKPGQPPIVAVPGFWTIPYTAGTVDEFVPPSVIVPGFSNDVVSTTFENLGISNFHPENGPLINTAISIGAGVYRGNTWGPNRGTPSFTQSPTRENTPKPTPPPKVKPAPPIPRPSTVPPDNSRPGTPNLGNPGGFTPPSFSPPVLPFLPLGITPPQQPNAGYLGNPTPEGINPGTQKSPPSSPGVSPDQRIPGARPTGGSPATTPQTAPERTPAARDAPTLQQSPAQSPVVNSPQIRTPSVTPKGDTKTSYESPTFDQWVKNNPAPWNSPEGVSPTTRSDIKTPSTVATTGSPFSPQNTGTIKPSAEIPASIPLPIGARIPANAIAQPIITPDVGAPSSACNYKPDATVSVGLASYNPLTDTITYTPTLVSASNAAGFAHLAQETANMRKEVSGIHKVLEVDLYRSPTGKIVAPKAECEVLQTVMSVSPLAAVPLIKTLPQEMKVLAAMNHMYSGHHLLGNIKVSSNPAKATAATYAPLTAVGMQFALYNNVTSMIGLPNAVSTVTAKGAIIDSPFKNSMDALENVSATTQGLETDVSGLQEMVFKVLQNQEMLINMVHKETFKTEVLIKDTGCRITEIPVQRPSVMAHGNAKTPVKKGFNWLNVFAGGTAFTNVPVWKGDIDKQQLGLKTNMEAQKANTSVYFPIADKGDSKLPKLQTRPKKGNEFNRFVKTLNETPPSQGDTPSIYDGPGLPKAKLEEVILGNVKKIVVQPDVEFIGANPPLAGVTKGGKPK